MSFIRQSNLFTGELVVILIEILFIWLVITPLVIYHTVQYYQHRNSVQLSRRHIPLVIGMSISILVYTTAGRTVSLCRKIGYREDPITAFDMIFYITGAYTLMNIVLWRLFLLNFKIKYTMMIEQGEWIQHINAKSTKQSNWYETHRTTVGNLRWMLRWFIPILLFQFAVLVYTSRLVNVVDHLIFYATAALFDLIVIVTIWVLYCKTPRFADVFGCRDEAKYILRLGLFGFVSFVATAIVDSNFSSGPGKNTWIQLNEVILDGVFLGLSMISTYWALNRFSHESILSNMSVALLAQKEHHHVSLATFLTTSAGVYAFMSHLCREFSSENLLFIYESLQFKELCAAELDDIGTQEEAADELDVPSTKETRQRVASKERELQRKIVLPKDLPPSDIVHSEKSIRDKFALLTEKYVLYSAEFQINIPGQGMQCISNKYNKREAMSQMDLYEVFDDAIKVVSRLMDESYARFCRTPQFIVALDDALVKEEH